MAPEGILSVTGTEAEAPVAGTAGHGSGLLVLTPLRVEAAMAGSSGARVVRTGAGPERAAAAAQRASGQEAQAVAVVGVGGALVADLGAGDLVVGEAVDGPGGRVELGSPRLLVAALRRAGLAATAGVVRSSGSVVTGGQREQAAATGAVVADTESYWLAPAAAGRPFAVVRAVVDGPGRELRRPAVVTEGIRALASLRRAMPVLSSWAEACCPRTVLLAGPRSFCAGVDRAIEIVERVLERFGAPVYVRRQIVHNAHVVRRLEAEGAVFVEELDEVPDGTTVVLSAHGVAPAVKEEAGRRGLRVVDATCPLVAKVHSEARRFSKQGRQVVLIGHDGHDEVEGTLGEVPGTMLVGSVDDVDALDVPLGAPVALLNQTTLAPSDVAEVARAVRRRFADVVEPPVSDICFATENRQQAIEAIAGDVDLVLVVGSANSSNSQRLVEVAERAGAQAYLVEDPDAIELEWLKSAEVVGLTAGASAPEQLVQEVVDALGGLGPVDVHERVVVDERVRFQLPSEVR